MFVFGNFIVTMARLLDILLLAMFWLILIRALISWVNPDPFNAIVQFLYRATDPLLEPIRRRLPLMPLDISPMIVILGIWFLRNFLIASLLEIGYRMQ